MNFSIIGLGKLGSSLAVAMASRGAKIIGYDIAPENVDAINKGRAAVWEPGLEEGIREYKDHISATHDLNEAVAQSSVTFVVVPTPSNENGTFNLSYAKDVFQKIGIALHDKKEFHLVVLVSTVLPGDTREVLIPAIEGAANKVCDREFGVCYSPAFIALGNIIRDFLHPDLVLIGASGEKSGELLTQTFEKCGFNSDIIKCMSIENAELTKIALNTFVTTKISFANMLSEMCNQLPGGDVDVVTNALGSDKRVGLKYLKGGCAYGGPCFPRDNEALSFWADKNGIEHGIIAATGRYNAEFTERLVKSLGQYIDHASTIAILGLAYKPDSNWAEEGQGVLLASTLSQKGKNVVGHDFLAFTMASKILSETNVKITSDPYVALDDADMVICTLPEPKYNEVLTEAFTKNDQKVIFVDMWRYYTQIVEPFPNVEIVMYGRGKD